MAKKNKKEIPVTIAEVILAVANGRTYSYTTEGRNVRLVKPYKEVPCFDLCLD
jgi:hypothetical protein